MEQDGQSTFGKVLEDIHNFSEINQFLSLLLANLNTLINILERENDQFTLNQNVAIDSFILMDFLILSLSKSVHKRIVW